MIFIILPFVATLTYVLLDLAKYVIHENGDMRYYKCSTLGHSFTVTKRFEGYSGYVYDVKCKSCGYCYGTFSDKTEALDSAKRR